MTDQEETMLSPDESLRRAAEEAGMTVEQFQKKLKDFVDGPYVGRPESCMSRRRIEDLASGSSHRPAMEEETEHLDSCVNCKREYEWLTEWHKKNKRTH
jgi:hypothetical protein